MKKKNFFYLAALAMCMTLPMASCSDNDDPTPDNGGEVVDDADLNITSENASAWGNYMYNVAMLLNDDSNDLYSYWTEDYDGKGPYATIFKD